MSEPEKYERTKRIHAIKFAAILSVVCCLLITGASTGLKSFQQENRTLDRQKNILRATGIVTLDASPPGSRFNRCSRRKSMK